jgi:hypothetical protein
MLEMVRDARFTLRKMSQDDKVNKEIDEVEGADEQSCKVLPKILFSLSRCKIVEDVTSG